MGWASEFGMGSLEHAVHAKGIGMANEISKWAGITLTDAVGRMLEESGKPIKAVSADMGKPYSTLCRELDPADEGAKLGVDTLYPLICSICGSTPETPPLPLQWLAARLGFRCVPVSRHQLDAEASPDAVRAMRVLVDFVALCEDRSASIEVVTAAYDAASYEVEKFACKAGRARQEKVAMPSLRVASKPSWWKIWR